MAHTHPVQSPDTFITVNLPEEPDTAVTLSVACVSATLHTHLTTRYLNILLRTAITMTLNFHNYPSTFPPAYSGTVTMVTPNP